MHCKSLRTTLIHLTDSCEHSRMCSELRLDRPLDDAAVYEYGQLATLPRNALALLARDREVTVGVMFCLDLW